MDWRLWMGPLIGALIGYCTNYIAVKMLFRPYEPKYLFGHRLPFTPGIIPKSKDRIAGAIGTTLVNHLLTPETLKSYLLAPDLKQKIAGTVNSVIERETADDRKVRDVITYYMDGEEFDQLAEREEAAVSEMLTIKMLDLDLGSIVGESVLRAIREKQDTSWAAKFMTENFIHSLISKISEKTNEIVVEEGPGMIQNLIHRESSELQEKTMGELFTRLKGTGIDIGEKVVQGYEVVLDRRMESILNAVDFSRIAREKISAMDPRQLEQLTLSVAKKELSAIVNLGALIGFVLGLLNLLTAL